MHVGQSKIPPAVAVRQLRVINSHQMQDGGVQIVDMNFVLDRVPAEFIRRAVNDSTLNAAAGHPHRETERMMFAAIRPLRRRRASVSPHFLHKLCRSFKGIVEPPFIDCSSRV